MVKSTKIIDIGDAGYCFSNRLNNVKNSGKIQRIALNTHVNFDYGDGIKIIEFDNSGLDATSNPLIGRQITEENKDLLFDILVDTSYLVIIVGMGGGIGTGASPVLAYVSKELNIKTTAVVSTPFDFESKQRQKIATHGINALKRFIDDVVIIEGAYAKNKLLFNYSHLFNPVIPENFYFRII